MAVRTRLYVDGLARGNIPLPEGQTSSGIRLTSSQADVLVCCRRLLGLGLYDLYDEEDVDLLAERGLVEVVETKPWDFSLTVSGAVAADRIASQRQLEVPAAPLELLSTEQVSELVHRKKRTIAHVVQNGALVPDAVFGRQPLFAFLPASVGAWRDRTRRRSQSQMTLGS